MDSFEVNKVLGAVLGTCLFAMGTGFLAELVYTPRPAGHAGYPLPGGGAEGEHGGGGGGESAKKEESKKEEKKEDGVAALLVSADAEKGKGGTKACQACHSFEKGGPNKIGPDLWGVVERKKGSHEGFDYSAGMKEKGGAWTYEDLNAFLTKPSDYVKGTKMAFGGIGSPQDRANVIAYLRTLADSPKPLPEAKKDEDAKPAQKAETKPEGDKKPADKPAEAKPADGGDTAPKSSASDGAAPAEPASKPDEGAEKKADDANTGVQPSNEKPAEEKPEEKPKE